MMCNLKPELIGSEGAASPHSMALMGEFPIQEAWIGVSAMGEEAMHCLQVSHIKCL